MPDSEEDKYLMTLAVGHFQSIKRINSIFEQCLSVVPLCPVCPLSTPWALRPQKTKFTQDIVLTSPQIFCWREEDKYLNSIPLTLNTARVSSHHSSVSLPHPSRPDCTQLFPSTSHHLLGLCSVSALNMVPYTPQYTYPLLVSATSNTLDNFKGSRLL